MPLTTSNKAPAIRRSILIGSFAARLEVKLSAISGNNAITGTVPTAKPNMTKDPITTSALIAAAANADASVIHGSATVTNPNAKVLVAPSKRLDQAEALAARRVRERGAQVNSRLVKRKKPCNATMTPKKTANTLPAYGTYSPTFSDTAATRAPISEYEMTRPILYNATCNQSCFRLILTCAKRAHAKGPHIAAQCHDITKLNQTIETTVATSTVSTVCSRCSK